MVSSDGVASVHVLFFPYPAQGHMIPLLDFAHDLARYDDDNLTITVVVTPSNLPLLNPLLSKSPTVHPLVLPFSHPSIPPGVENVKGLPPAYFFYMIHAMGSLHAPLLRWARSTPTPPDVIVSDFFLGWTNRLAADLGIPRVVFSPSNALTLSTLQYLWRNTPRREDLEGPDFSFSFSGIPRSPTFPWSQISNIYRRYKEGEPASEFVREGFFGNMNSWGCVINTFDALEGPYLEHLRKDLGHPRVWAVGPIGTSPTPSAAERGGASAIPVDALVRWLDTCADGSVVYVCFGSQIVLKQPQMDAIATALETSGVRFVWCARPSPEVDGEDEDVVGFGVVPEWFEERTSGKGVVIRGWAPQVALLSHRAVGAFLTHCGWNSTLEAVGAGVLLLAWPFRADQFLNARLLVDELGAGVKVCEGPDVVPDPAELAGIFRDVTSGTCVGSRNEVVGLRQKALDSVAAGGSSSCEMDRFVDELRRVKLGREG